MRSTKNNGFSLIELLVVIAIIALLIGILLPALAGVRNAAKGSKSKALMASVQQGISRSKVETGALPGLFTQTDLGSLKNGDAGLTAMENILLDLAAGDGLIGRVDLVDANGADFGNPDTNQMIKVGVDTGDKTKQYYVNPGLFGSGTPELILDGGDLANMTNDGVDSIAQHSKVVGSGPGSFANTGTTDQAEWSMPDLIDAFGQPIMAWVRDDYGPTEVDQNSYSDALNDFVREDSEEPAWFYLNSNAGYLATDSFGNKLNAIYQDSTSEKDGSMIGSMSAGAVSFGNDERDAFMALYGNTAYPDDPNKSDKQNIFATESAHVIIQSAGVDGVYFRRGESAANANVSGMFRFGAAFSGGGDPKSLAVRFDDLLVQFR